MIKDKINNILKKAAEEHNLYEEEILFLLKNAKEELFECADEQRKKFVGDEVHLRGLIEFSNICKCNCQYCGLQKDNKKLERYRLSKEEIINTLNKTIYNYSKVFFLGTFMNIKIFLI